MAKSAVQAKPKLATVAEAEEARPDGAPEALFEITTSRQFESWLAEQGINLAFTTYQAGKLFFLGLDETGRLSVFNRTLERCMGLAYADDTLSVASLYQILTFVDAAAGQPEGGIDGSLFVPQASTFTGDVDAHDLAIRPDGGITFVNTLFSCIAETSATHSFKPVWQPPFIDRLAAEDRCHLNGLAMDGAHPAYATAVADTNVADGWRDHRADGGLVVDCRSNETVVSGLMQAQLDTEVPVVSVVLTPHHYHECEEHRQFFLDHFRIKGREAAEACVSLLDMRKDIHKAA